MSKVHMLSYQNILVGAHLFPLSEIDEAYDHACGLSEYGSIVTMKHVRGYLVEKERNIKWLKRGEASFKYGIMTNGTGTLNILPRIRRKTLKGCIKN